MGKVIQSGLPCPDQSNCGSSDAFSRYVKPNGMTDGHCFSCHRWFPDPFSEDQEKAQSSIVGSPGTSSLPATTQRTYSETGVTSVEEALSHPIRALAHRGISYQTCEHYGVRVGVDTRDGETPIYHLYPVHRDGTLTGYTQRILPKQFLSIGDCKSPDLFGAHAINQSGKKLFITEGVLDCLSLYQILKEQSSIDWSPPVVSLPNGTSAVQAINRSFELISRYEQIILCLDQDSAGQEATKEICKILAGKVYVAKYSEKDPNDMLLKNKATELKWAVLTNARKYQPDGILNGKDCWDRYKNARTGTYFPYPCSMPGLNEKCYGMRPGSIVTLTSGSGCGKTQFKRELEFHYLKTTDLKIADISLEEDLSETIGGMLSLQLNKRITLPDVDITDEEERQAFDDLYGTGRIEFYDFFGGMDDANLFSKLKYLIHDGCGMIFLDHLSIVISEFAAEGGERERIDTIMTKLAKLVKETNAIIVLIVHLRKTEGKSFELGAVPTLDDLRGSGSIKQLSWDVLGLSRNQQHPSPVVSNTTELTVLKCRFTGRTGHAGYLFFDDSSGRMIQTEQPEGYRK